MGERDLNDLNINGVRFIKTVADYHVHNWIFRSVVDEIVARGGISNDDIEVLRDLELVVIEQNSIQLAPWGKELLAVSNELYGAYWSSRAEVQQAYLDHARKVLGTLRSVRLRTAPLEDVAAGLRGVAASLHARAADIEVRAREAACEAREIEASAMEAVRSGLPKGYSFHPSYKRVAA